MTNEELLQCAILQIDYLFVVYRRDRLDDLSEFSYCLDVVLNGACRAAQDDGVRRTLVGYAKGKYVAEYMDGLVVESQGEYDSTLKMAQDAWKRIVKKGRLLTRSTKAAQTDP